MRWYVEPLAYDQRSFNAAALRLVDDLQEQVDRLQAEVEQLRSGARRTRERGPHARRRSSATLLSAGRQQRLWSEAC